MKRLLTFFLAAAIACSLFGCAQQGQTETKPNNTNILVNQACQLAQTLAMSTEPGYLQALEFTGEIIDMAATFGQAIGKEPEEAKIVTVEDADFLSKVLEVCGTANGSVEVGCCGMLSFSSQFYMETAPEKPTAIYLRYSEQCNMLVYFTSERTHIVDATIYPLFAETAAIVLEDYFADASVLTKEAIAQACEAAKSISVAGKYSDSKINELHYFKQATTAFVDTEAIELKDIEACTQDPDVIRLVQQFAEVLSKQASKITLFRFPYAANQQAIEALGQTQYADELEEVTFQRCFLSWINHYTNPYGEVCATANAVIASLASNRPLGYVANKNAAPTLVVLELSADVTMLMSIYPGENNIYAYSFVCIPTSYGEACNLVRKSGAQQFK